VGELRQRLPNFGRLALRKGYCGGGRNHPTSQETMSGPGWATLLTGVWANKHGIGSNSTALRANPAFPTVLARIKHALPRTCVGAVAGWKPIVDSFFVDDLKALDAIHAVSRNDGQCITLARQLIADSGSRDALVFVALAEADYVGHEKGFGDDYDRSIVVIDAQVGELLDVVEASNDEWLVLVCVDHGRQLPLGRDHGGGSEYERSILVGGKLYRSGLQFNAEFEAPALNPADTTLNGLFGTIAQTSLAPTILRYFGIPIQVDDGMESAPLIGPPGIRKLAVSGRTFSWYPAGTYATRISFLVPAGTTTWRAPLSTSRQEFVFQSEEPGSAPVTRCTGYLNLIRVAIDWTETHAILFLDSGKYSHYSYALDQVESGYPRAVDESVWPGLSGLVQDVLCGFPRGDGTVCLFLRGGRYMVYGQDPRRVVVQPATMTEDQWPVIAKYREKIRTCVKWPDNQVYLFFDNDEYIRFDARTYQPAHPAPYFYSEATWPGLSSAIPHTNQLVTATRFNDAVAYFFFDEGKYIRYDVKGDRTVPPVRLVSDNTWPGIERL
jgi:hypothetical protein